MKKFSSYYLMFLTVVIIMVGCGTKDDPILLATLTTTEPSAVSSTTASSGGIIASDGGSTVTARGVCWSTNSNPTIEDEMTINGVGIGSFISAITGLTPITTYYVRAYATNAKGTAYGFEYQITTHTRVGSIKTALIPAGTFTMGSPATEVNRSTEETQHSVTLNSFRMSKYEITNVQYAAFLNAKGIGSDGKYAAGAYPTQALIYTSSGSYDWGLHYTNSQWVPVADYENAPVINVTWYGATEYATYVEGTLPTEAQWEYACRAGTTTPFNTGNCLTNLQANYIWGYPYGTCTNTETTPLSKPQPVGTYAPNAYGLYDMHGNVWEWCADWYGTYPTTEQTNPTGAATGLYRVIRGGSWYGSALVCRSAYRNGISPGESVSRVGFRVVFDP